MIYLMMFIFEKMFFDIYNDRIGFYNLRILVGLGICGEEVVDTMVKVFEKPKFFLPFREVLPKDSSLYDLDVESLL